MNDRDIRASRIGALVLTNIGILFIVSAICCITHSSVLFFLLIGIQFLVNAWIVLKNRLIRNDW